MTKIFSISFLVVSFVITSYTLHQDQAKPAVVTDTKKSYSGKGVGRFTDFSPEPFSKANADKGEKLFSAKCAACHKADDSKLIGPGLKGATQRRTPAWIMNKMTNAPKMQTDDAMGKALNAEYKVPMVVQISDDEAKLVFDYLRKIDGKK